MYKHRKFRNTTVTKWNAFLLVYCTKPALLIKHTIFKYLQKLLIPKTDNDWDLSQLNLDILLDTCIRAGHPRLPLWSMEKSRGLQRTIYLHFQVV